MTVTKKYKVIDGRLVTGHINRNGEWVDSRPVEVKVKDVNTVEIRPKSGKEGPVAVCVEAVPVNKVPDPSKNQDRLVCTQVEYRYLGHSWTANCRIDLTEKNDESIQAYKHHCAQQQKEQAEEERRRIREEEVTREMVKQVQVEIQNLLQTCNRRQKRWLRKWISSEGRSSEQEVRKNILSKISNYSRWQHVVTRWEGKNEREEVARLLGQKK